MAKCTRTTIKVSKPVEYIDEKVVTLELTELEAQCILECLGKVGGFDKNIPARTTINGICSSLHDAGFGFVNNCSYPRASFVEGNLEVTTVPLSVNTGKPRYW